MRLVGAGDSKIDLPLPTKVKSKIFSDFEDSDSTDPRSLAREQFKESISHRISNPSVYIRYALWEESHMDLDRARRLWEDAILTDNRNSRFWIEYAQFEMRNGNTHYARAVWDRAVGFLPQVDQLWYKYIDMEEILDNVAHARQVFERWMKWSPDVQAWLSYVKFEMRCGEVGWASGVFERLVDKHPIPTSFIMFAAFERKHGEIGRARVVYERAVDVLADDKEAELLFVKFAEFEEECKEIERARAIYWLALDRVPKGQVVDLYRKYAAFEKQYADWEGIEYAAMAKKRCQYEKEVRKNPLNYDCWFKYVRLEESVGSKSRIRELYRRATANVPQAEEKRHWRCYIYLWINYALFEEFYALDMNRTREVYKKCLDSIPHNKFSFAKTWLLAAQFEIRQKNLKAARQIFGNAIGIASNDKIFEKYIEFELQHGNIDCCRELYEKYVEWAPANCYAWTKYAELESSLSDTERARTIFERAIEQPALDMPELLWKAYIDFEMQLHEYSRTRSLYERQIDYIRQIGHIKDLNVWIRYAQFEASLIPEDEEYADDTQINDDIAIELKKKSIRTCRDVFQRAYYHFSKVAPELKEEKAMLLEEWLKMEKSFKHLGEYWLVQKKLPQKTKKWRAVTCEDESPAREEEYVDYIFPDESADSLDCNTPDLVWRKLRRMGINEL